MGQVNGGQRRSGDGPVHISIDRMTGSSGIDLQSPVLVPTNALVSIKWSCSRIVGQPEVEFLNAERRSRRVIAHAPGYKLTDWKPSAIHGQPAIFVNSDLHNFDSGA